jgi:hypothetical protein
MPRSFVAQVSNPDETFPRLKKWADANGYAIRGNAAKGTFRGTPSGVAGFLIGEIYGSYAVSGNAVEIQVNKDLPEGAVANALSKHGLRLVQAE